ncbi:MAG: hypothetical protein J6N71_05690 [Muribaculaceae bacterium]|nr:hypothetical protein [Muribaculaceae bacterium]
MKKKILNIRPQEVVADGQRSVRYKGSDGKFHGVASDDGGSTILSVEEVERIEYFSNGSIQSDVQPNYFMMRFGASRIKKFECANCHYSYSSINKLYLDNGVLGCSPFYYDLPNTAVKLCTVSGGVIEEIDRETFSTDMAAAKEFLERTINERIADVTPYNLYYLMMKSSFIITRSKVTFLERHLIGTDKDGTRHDYGIIHPIF